MTREDARYYLRSSGFSEEQINTIEQAFKQEPCEDVISRQAVLDFMRSLTRWCVRSKDGKFNNVGLLYDDVMFGIDKLPSVNPQPKTGHWRRELIRNEKGGCIGAKMICSRCGNDNKHDEYMNYCPNCGAKIEVVEV